MKRRGPDDRFTETPDLRLVSDKEAIELLKRRAQQQGLKEDSSAEKPTIN